MGQARGRAPHRTWDLRPQIELGAGPAQNVGSTSPHRTWDLRQLGGARLQSPPTHWMIANGFQGNEEGMPTKLSQSSIERRRSSAFLRAQLARLSLAFIGLLLAACAGAAEPPALDLSDLREPQPVVVDVDMAHEDMHAVLYLLQHPSVDVKAITVVGTGEAHCEPGVRHALGLVALNGAGDIPVACGRETPLEGDHSFPSAWRRDVDNLYGLRLPEGGEASSLSAPELIVSVTQASLEKVTIIAVGPLTNVAEAVLASPDMIDNVEMIYVMGGAVEVAGNVGLSGVGIDNSFAEWNIYVDPQSANIVFNSGAPVTLVPLDATKDAPVTTRFYRRLEDQRNSPEAEFVYELLTASLGFVQSGGFQFWDSLTAAIFTDESLATFRPYEIWVVEEEGPESGFTKPVPGGAEVRVAISADGRRFEEMFLEVLNLP